MQVAIFLQLLWVIGSIFWNLTGLDLAEEGQGLPRPNPSWEAVILLLMIGILLLVLHKFRLKKLFRLVSLAGTAYAGYCLFMAFLSESELLINESWQLGGIVINFVGFFAGLAGVFGRFTSKAYRPDPISQVFDDSSPLKE